jgi:integrase
MSIYKPAKKPFYLYDFKLGGDRFHGSTGVASKREAEAVEKLKREEARLVIVARANARSPTMTLDVACDRYWLEVGQHHARPDQTAWSMAWLLKNLGGGRPLASITGSEVARIIAIRRGEHVENVAKLNGKSKRRRVKAMGEAKLVSPARVNRSVTEPLRKVLRRAQATWGQEVAPIAWRDHMLKEPKERVRSMTDEEEANVFAVLPAQFWPVIRFALKMGVRLNNCVTLPWTAIDWGSRTITMVVKGDKVATIPMPSDIRDLLWPLQGKHPTRIFTYESGRPVTVSGLDTAWGRALERAGVTNFRFHDLRHTAATRLLRKSKNLKMVQKLLCHENIATTAKYAHVFDEDLRDALESMGDVSAPQVPTENEMRAAGDRKSRPASRPTKPKRGKRQ